MGFVCEDGCGIMDPSLSIISNCGVSVFIYLFKDYGFIENLVFDMGNVASPHLVE